MNKEKIKELDSRDNMRYSAKIKKILLHSGAMGLAHRLSGSRQAAILRYHAVVDSDKNYYASPSICISPKIFEHQIRVLSERYNIISLDTLADCIYKQSPFPEKAVVLTFDDGYRDNYLAYRIMKKYGIEGTFYITVNCLEGGDPLWLFEVKYLIEKTAKPFLEIYVNKETVRLPLVSSHNRIGAVRRITEIIKSNNLKTREDIRSQLREQMKDVSDLAERASRVMLTWEQVCEMSENGMIIGAHTMTHLNLPNADFDDAFHEINDCREAIKDKTGRIVRHFSYPNSGNYKYYNKSVKEIVKRAGYSTSTTSNNGTADLMSDPFELRRIRVTYDLSEIIYQIECEPIIDSIFEKLYGYKNN